MFLVNWFAALCCMCLNSHKMHSNKNPLAKIVLAPEFADGLTRVRPPFSIFYSKRWRHSEDLVR